MTRSHDRVPVAADAEDELHLLDDGSNAAEAGVSLRGRHDGCACFDDHAFARGQVSAASNHDGGARRMHMDAGKKGRF